MFQHEIKFCLNGLKKGRHEPMKDLATWFYLLLRKSNDPSNSSTPNRRWESILIFCWTWDLGSDVLMEILKKYHPATGYEHHQLGWTRVLPTHSAPNSASCWASLSIHCLLPRLPRGIWRSWRGRNWSESDSSLAAAIQRQTMSQDAADDERVNELRPQTEQKSGPNQLNCQLAA